jgi:hypothetical protein
MRKPVALAREHSPNGILIERADLGIGLAFARNGMIGKAARKREYYPLFA